MPSNPTYLLLNQNSDYFFSGHKGGLIISWDLESNKSKANLQAHKSEIKSLFIPNINKNNNGITNNPNNFNNSNSVYVERVERATQTDNSNIW